MVRLTRREFIRNGAAAAGVLAGTRLPFAAEKRSATDWVTLGRSGIRVTRLAFGTGTNGGSVQRALGQEAFTRLVRHAYDRGIRFFESADNYDQMHEMLAEALKGIDRGTYKLMTKMKWGPDADVKKDLDRFRKELNTDHLDIVLLHCVRTTHWAEELKSLRDGLSEAKEKKIILAHGCSCHGLDPLRSLPSVDWLDVALVRINHDGTYMDGSTGEWGEPGHQPEATLEIKKLHESGAGVIGMKLIGNGNFTEADRRDASIRFVMQSGLVDAATIGYKSSAEVDEAIERIEKYLNV